MAKSSTKRNLPNGDLFHREIRRDVGPELIRQVFVDRVEAEILGGGVLCKDLSPELSGHCRGVPAGIEDEDFGRIRLRVSLENKM